MHRSVPHAHHSEPEEQAEAALEAGGGVVVEGEGDLA
jgi:hypothetical protein